MPKWVDAATRPASEARSVFGTSVASVRRALMPCGWLVGVNPPLLLLAAVALFLSYRWRRRQLLRHQPHRPSKNDSRVEHQQLVRLHEASYHLTSSSPFSGSTLDKQVWLAWTNDVCRGDRDRIHLFGRLLWYRQLCGTSSLPTSPASAAKDDRRVPPRLSFSWTTMVTWACQNAPRLPVLQAALVVLDSVDLGDSHLIWPAVAIDLLLASALPTIPPTDEWRPELAMAARIRGHLVLMGVLHPHTISSSTDSHVHGYRLINCLAWEQPHRQRRRVPPGRWSKVFLDRLTRIAFLDKEDGKELLAMTSKAERTMLCNLLPRICLHFGDTTRALHLLRDPFVTYCRLLGPGATIEWFTPSLPQTPCDMAMVNESSASAAVVDVIQLTLLLSAQVLWKQRCCSTFAKTTRSTESQLFRLVGIRLGLNHQGTACREEARRLDRAALAQALVHLVHALRYSAIVLWSKGQTLDTFERRTSRRIFALQEELGGVSTNTSSLAHWLETVDTISKGLSSTTNVDLLESHRRLSTALQTCQRAHDWLLETLSLLKEDAPDLIDECR
jgi:hypothetical protein